MSKPPTIDPEFHALIPTLSDEERGQLEANVLQDGCRDPLATWLIDGKRLLLDGHNRYDICRWHNIHFNTVDIILPNRDAAKAWIIRNQFGRRNLTPYQRCELALALEPLVRARAKENTRDGGRRGGTSSSKGCQKSDKPSIDTKKELAKEAGVSHDTIERVRKIAKSAPEEVKQKLRRGETTINREYKAIVKAERKAEQVRQVKVARHPDGKFHVIVADPPWSYERRPDDPTHRSACPYPCMPVDDIMAMPVKCLTHDNAILWLWTTNAFMVQAHNVVAAWGFQVKTILTWVKDRMGTGDWLRGQTEHCLMCIRGKPVVELTNQTTVLNAKMREHSRKPDEFYAMVEILCPGLKCELFSRQERDGWQVFGAEIGKFQ